MLRSTLLSVVRGGLLLIPAVAKLSLVTKAYASTTFIVTKENVKTCLHGLFRVIQTLLCNFLAIVRIRYRIIFKHLSKTNDIRCIKLRFSASGACFKKSHLAKYSLKISTLIRRCLTGRGVEQMYHNLRFSFTYQHFSLDFTTVHYEDITENDRRVKFLWKALENFTNGKIRLLADGFFL